MFRFMLSCLCLFGQEIEANEDDEWEYREEGPPEIIWQGNEIIVKKNRVRVKKKDADQQVGKQIFASCFISKTSS